MSRRAQSKKADGGFNPNGYLTTSGLLPGESNGEFEELRKSLIVEFTPDGPLELDIVSSLAQLLWRKQNLVTLRKASWARTRRKEILAEELDRRGIKDPLSLLLLGGQDQEAYQKAHQEAARAADERARDELGKDFELTQESLGTESGLMAELDLEERLDAAINDRIERLQSLRKLKRNRY
jgi:hypothetical protein